MSHFIRMTINPMTDELQKAVWHDFNGRHRIEFPDGDIYSEASLEKSLGDRINIVELLEQEG